jgi:hypothetical protein
MTLDGIVDSEVKTLQALKRRNTHAKAAQKQTKRMSDKCAVTGPSPHSLVDDGWFRTPSCPDVLPTRLRGMAISIF